MANKTAVKGPQFLPTVLKTEINLITFRLAEGSCQACWNIKRPLLYSIQKPDGLIGRRDLIPDDPEGRVLSMDTGKQNLSQEGHIQLI